MKSSSALLLMFLMQLGLPSAHAFTTHTAQVDLELIQVNEQGVEHSLKRLNGDFHLDWKAKKCEIQLKKHQFVYCNLDTSQDVFNSKNDLVMKALPQAHFDPEMMNALMNTMGIYTKQDLTFNLPFYTCANCEKVNEKTYLWNAFQSFVSRDLLIQPGTSLYKKLILRMKIKKMEAIKGAFNVIDHNNTESQ